MEITSEFLATMAKLVIEPNKLSITIDKINTRATARRELEKTFKNLATRCGLNFTMVNGH